MKSLKQAPDYFISSVVDVARTSQSFLSIWSRRRGRGHVRQSTAAKMLLKMHEMTSLHRSCRRRRCCDGRIDIQLCILLKQLAVLDQFEIQLCMLPLQLVVLRQRRIVLYFVIIGPAKMTGHERKFQVFKTEEAGGGCNRNTS